MAAHGSGTARKHTDDNIPTYEYVDTNTNPVHIGGFANLWREKLGRERYSFEAGEEHEDDALLQGLGITMEIMQELKTLCSVDTLATKAEGVNTDVVPEEPHLQTLRLRKRKQDYRESCRDVMCRHDVFASALENSIIGRKPEDPQDLVCEGETMVTIKILYPPHHRCRFAKRFQMLQVLGSQTLTQLRDSICCVSDLQISGEFSNTPDMAPDYISKDLYKSAFFYFEGLFYNDMRYPECMDMSKNIIDWAKTQDFPTFRSTTMEGVTLNDLKPKIGYPYLYCHQGSCEHIVIITDVRLVHRDDCLDKKFYPLLIYKHRVITKKCAVCHTYISRWMTTNDRLAATEPCLFCDKCFRMLHYDEQGNKIGDFLAYPYVDPGAFN